MELLKEITFQFWDYLSKASKLRALLLLHYTSGKVIYSCDLNGLWMDTPPALTVEGAYGLKVFLQTPRLGFQSERVEVTSMKRYKA